jgi:S-formylglutathione hydrolase FrmB
LYLLHGLSDDQTAWTRRTSLERYVEGLPLIVVMPDGGRGWYSDSVTEPAAAWETYIVRDLIGFVDRVFRTKATRAGRAIAGLSMGGYGAVKLALKYPELFCAAVSHSGALRRPHEGYQVYEGGETHRIFGDQPGGGSNDVYALAEKFAPCAQTSATPPCPALRVDCGTSDYLIENSRAFHRHLETLAIPHEYAEHPGAHDWAYWDEHVEETIAFVSGALGIWNG